VGPGRCMWSSVDGVQPYAFWAPSGKHGMYLPKSPLFIIVSEKCLSWTFKYSFL